MNFSSSARAANEKAAAPAAAKNFDESRQKESFTDLLSSQSANCACGGSCPRCGTHDTKENRSGSSRTSGFLQTKIAVGAANDPLEQEADHVADKIMSAASHSAIGTTAAPGIRRFSGHSASHEQAAPRSVDRTLANGGNPMDSATREFFESRFQRGFDDVRVHTDQQAAQSARDVDALAYTVGRNIVFDSGLHAPHTDAGKRLLAHELTHVVQQSGSSKADGMNRKLYRYRSKGKDTIAFEGADETLTDPKTQPWIDNITIAFDKAVVDTGHKADAASAGQIEPRMPTGTLTAKYSTKSSAVPADIVLSITGGSTMLGIGLTDRVTAAKVKRLEGNGYTDSQNISAGNLTDPVAKSGKGARYSKSGNGTMNYAIFFKGIQAIHEGGLNIGSHACVHVGSQPSIRTLNHHTRIGQTTVTVTYDSTVLKDLCCYRKKTGNTNWNANPCEKTKCP